MHRFSSIPGYDFHQLIILGVGIFCPEVKKNKNFDQRKGRQKETTMTMFFKPPTERY
jgi:hypothetical protein